MALSLCISVHSWLTLRFLVTPNIEESALEPCHQPAEVQAETKWATGLKFSDFSVAQHGKLMETDGNWLALNIFVNPQPASGRFQILYSGWRMLNFQSLKWDDSK